jgi:hypothetical protein
MRKPLSFGCDWVEVVSPPKPWNADHQREGNSADSVEGTALRVSALLLIAQRCRPKFSPERPPRPCEQDLQL